ncbi:type VI secretion system protein TssA [Oxalobacteraceae bacterium]|nr:type VI secretion system protein TssA [Oxalobacteraceae bacterium]
MFSADQLLNPISDSQPAGADLSFAPDLDAIAQARRFDDPSLDQGEWVTDLKEADWDFVVTRCAALLADKSKDLKLAVWLTEAASKRHHLRGLAEGYRVLAGLIERFWDLGLYPEADGDDHDQRIGNLSWILARTPALLREVPLTEGRATAYSTIDFETARKLANSSNGSSSAAANGQPKLADLETAKRNNSPQFCAAFAADARYCMDALQELERASDARLGHDSPGFSTARDAIETMLHAMPATAVAVVDAGANGGNAGAQENSAGFTESPAGYNVVPVQSGPPGAIQNRTQAIAQLRAVAEFFRRTEPHSPVSYFAEKAANAGEQDLHTWLRSVVKDNASLAHIEELLGVQPVSN